MDRTASRVVRDVYVFGGRGGGALAALTLMAMSADGGGLRFAGYLNDTLPVGTEVCCGSVHGPFESWAALPADAMFVAPLHAPGALLDRRRLVEGLGIPHERWATLVDPRAYIAPGATIGHGSFIGPGSMVGPNTSIGSHVALRHGSHLGHDSSLGAFSFMGVNSVLCGWCTVGDSVHLAPNASVRDRISVGSGAVIGLGAVVVDDVPPNTVVAGCPAVPIGPT